MIYISYLRYIFLIFSLSNSFIAADFINACKDKLWLHQDIKFDFKANLTGTTNQSNQSLNLYWFDILDGPLRCKITDTAILKCKLKN